MGGLYKEDNCHDDNKNVGLILEQFMDIFACTVVLFSLSFECWNRIQLDVFGFGLVYCEFFAC